jgi:hypothetical protein
VPTRRISDCARIPGITSDKNEIIKAIRLGQRSIENASRYAGDDEKSSGILIRDQDLFLAQKIEVGLAAGTRVDDGGKVPGKIVGVTVGVLQGESKRDLHRDLGSPDDFAVFPGLTVNRDFPTGSLSAHATQRSRCK